MDSGFIKGNVLPTRERNSENHVLLHNTVCSSSSNNHVLLARYASDLLHNYTTLVNCIPLVDNLLNQTNDNIKPKQVTVKNAFFILLI